MPLSHIDIGIAAVCGGVEAVDAGYNVGGLAVGALCVELDAAVAHRCLVFLFRRGCFFG